MSWYVVVLLVLGAVLLFCGVLFRLGLAQTARMRARWYHMVRRNPDAPEEWR